MGNMEGIDKSPFESSGSYYDGVAFEQLVFYAWTTHFARLLRRMNQNFIQQTT